MPVPPAVPELIPAPLAPTPDIGTAQKAAEAPNPLTCTRPVVLTDVHIAGSRVVVGGIAREQYAGKSIVIKSGAKRLAGTTVRADGTFEAGGPKPSAAAARSVRYVATVDGKRSAPLGISRLAILGQQRSGDDVRVRGRLTGAKSRAQPLSVARREGCPASTAGTVKRLRTSSSGAFTVTLARPSTPGEVAVYRITAGGGRISALALVRHDG